MSNPIRRVVRTIGHPANPQNTSTERIEDDLLIKELQNYLEGLAQEPIEEAPRQEHDTPSEPPTVSDQIEHEIRVEIPHIGSPLHCRRVISDLENAFTQTPPRSRWIVDLRALEVLPLLLIGALERYQGELAESGGLVRLELNAAISYPEPILSRLASSFELCYLDGGAAIASDDSEEIVDIDEIVQQGGPIGDDEK